MGDEADIERMVGAFVDEVNRGDFGAAVTRFTAAATIVEDIAPFRWHGPNAAGEWLTAMGANAARLGVTSVRMDLGEAQRIEVEDARAYAIFAGTVTLDRPDGPLTEKGALTFALERDADAWLIAALTWTGGRPVAE